MQLKIRSKRGTLINAFGMHADSDKGFVLFAHSFKGESDEDGRYEELAQRLSKAGIGSLRMDFPGSINSEESDREYSIRNCLDDLESCYEYALKEYRISDRELGLIGYSMGGRIVSLFALDHPEFKKILLWAPCNHVFKADECFLEQDLSKLKLQADKEGYCDFFDIFSETTTVFPKRFIDDLLDERVDDFHNYEGKVLIIHGDKDITVKLKESVELYEKLDHTNDKELFIIEGADHGFGLWDGRQQDNDLLIKKSCEFFGVY
ncbi:MAG: alpha/beta fold hydrolase [Erysipelotrichaceae bacterium]|nr:alpha/beta fold hydrolase [Erysipelotrichaceae bacterium]